MFLCKEISEVEWSGVLFYNITGSIRELSKFSIDLVDIFLMDKGNSTYTEYNFDEEVAGYMMDKMMENPSFANIKLGHIHSHNKMAVFFSGTDMDELSENCVNHAFYLSLIVNNLLEMKAKLVYHTTVEEKREYTAKDEKGEEYKFDLPGLAKECMMEHDCIIETPFKAPKVENSFRERVNQIIEKSKAKFTKKEEKPEVKVQGLLPPAGPNIHQKFIHTKNGWEPNPNYVDKEDGKDKEAFVVSDLPKNNSFEQDTEPLNQYFDTDQLDDRRIDIDEAFACFLLRLGVNFKDDTIEEAAGYLASEGMTGDKLCKYILPDYGKLYNKFYKDMATVDMDDFMTTVENVIMFMEEFEGKYNFLQPLIEELSEFQKELENSWRTKVVLGTGALVN